MCDPVLIAAILEELGYLDEKTEKDRKEEVREEGRKKDSSQNSREEKKITHLFMPDPGDYLPLGCNDPLHLTSHNPQLFEPILPSQDYAQRNGLLPTYRFHPMDLRKNVLAKDAHPIRGRD
jgi:hypothetical protein